MTMSIFFTDLKICESKVQQGFSGLVEITSQNTLRAEKEE